ncbi:TNF receptor-associated factor 6-like [Dermacentor albipictus]|uniref:TNF receptor-associated factor 6-like n=1 Tax=Dermacentor albipictus TaxID=60249 RepID=UPI0031FCD4B4
MALEIQRYTLFGFSKEVDWRPLHFVDSIPAQRVCSACGLLPRVTVFLPCRHVLCDTCYEQSLVADQRACPLDGDAFLEDNVQWGDFPLENLLRRKVKCWNEDNGCEVVMAASDMPTHFCEDCAYHSARCPKCSEFVLRCNMCAHRRSNCSSHSVQNKRVNQKPSVDSIQEAMFTAFETILEERVQEMRSGLDQVARNNNAHYDKLNEVSTILNALRETVIQSSEKQTRATNEVTIAYVTQIKEGLAAQGKKLNDVLQMMSNLGEKVTVSEDTATKCLEKLEQTNVDLIQYFNTDENLLKKVSQTVRAFEGIFVKALERATESICIKCENNAVRIAASKTSETERGQKESAVSKDHLLGHNTLNVSTYEFYVKGLKSLKEKAISVGWASYSSDAIYLCGYYISPGVCLMKTESSVSVRALIQLHKGVIDEFLQWPFNQIVKLTFIGQSKGNRELPAQTGSSLEFYGRPTGRSNVAGYTNHSCDIEDLECEGYAKGDQLWVKFELLPPAQK